VYVPVRAVVVKYAVALAAAAAVTAASMQAGARSMERERVELSGPWSFRRVAHAGPQPEPEQAWLPATVPGCVHADLLANAKIGDPFYRLNEKDQQWIENEAWEYRTTLRVDAATLEHERVDLAFAGLDTFAEVFVNGVSVLRADNMFRSWRADVKARLKPGDNQLVVRFRSPIAEVKPAYDRLGYKLPAANDQAKEMVSMWARKAPYHYGWDWGPRFVTSGIWRPAALEAWDDVRLDDVQIIQHHIDAQAAEIFAKARLFATKPGKVKLTIALAGGPVLGQANVTLKGGTNDVALGGRIAKPELWWPSGLGAQKLYTIETILYDGKGTTHEKRKTRIGLRTLEVVHERDKEGKSFFIKVNGAPVFMKGANWIPADSFVTRVTEDRTRFLLQSAVDANMNMLRVWGGGIYESDRFYELCDELGLLVWQDFMFACSMYPGDDAFVENVRQEAIENVRRLRNHASLALWAGNNENEAAWKSWGWQTKFSLPRKAQDTISRDYKRMFNEVLPSVIAAEDPGRFYTRSSPSANDDKVPANRLGWGDMHYWGVWHAEAPYEAYADNVSRFMSEYGFQSFPELASVAHYTAGEADWNIESPVMLSHQRHPRGNPLIRTYMDRDFRKPKDFASFLYIGQVLQATVIKYAAEVHRRKMGRNWGSLYWQLDDCWPVASWSSIDYYGRWKALQYYARRFYAPVLVSPVDEKGTINVWGVSDRRADTNVRLSMRVLDFGGREIMRKDQDIVLAPNASKVYASFTRKDLLGAASSKQVMFVTEISEAGRVLNRNIHWFEKTKDLELPKPELKSEVSGGEKGIFAVKLTSNKLARAVFLHGVEGFFEDNYFDLLPGETVTVTLRAAPTATLQSIQTSLRATTIADSY